MLATLSLLEAKLEEDSATELSDIPELCELASIERVSLELLITVEDKELLGNELVNDELVNDERVDDELSAKEDEVDTIALDSAPLDDEPPAPVQPAPSTLKRASAGNPNK